MLDPPVLFVSELNTCIGEKDIYFICFILFEQLWNLIAICFEYKRSNVFMLICFEVNLK